MNGSALPALCLPIGTVWAGLIQSQQQVDRKAKQAKQEAERRDARGEVTTERDAGVVEGSIREMLDVMFDSIAVAIAEIQDDMDETIENQKFIFKEVKSNRFAIRDAIAQMNKGITSGLNQVILGVRDSVAQVRSVQRILNETARRADLRTAELTRQIQALQSNMNRVSSKLEDAGTRQSSTMKMQDDKLESLDSLMQSIKSMLDGQDNQGTLRATTDALLQLTSQMEDVQRGLAARRGANDSEWRNARDNLQALVSEVRQTRQIVDAAQAKQQLQLTGQEEKTEALSNNIADITTLLQDANATGTSETTASALQELKAQMQALRVSASTDGTHETKWDAITEQLTALDGRIRGITDSAESRAEEQASMFDKQAQAAEALESDLTKAMGTLSNRLTQAITDGTGEAVKREQTMKERIETATRKIDAVQAILTLMQQGATEKPADGLTLQKEAAALMKEAVLLDGASGTGDSTTDADRVESLKSKAGNMAQRLQTTLRTGSTAGSSERPPQSDALLAAIQKGVRLNPIQQDKGASQPSLLTSLSKQVDGAATTRNPKVSEDEARRSQKNPLAEIRKQRARLTGQSPGTSDGET